MAEVLAYPEISPDDFARRFSLRPRKIMWFLGAGVSAAAGIPTAGDLIWRLKRDLYVSQRKVALSSVANLSDPSVQATLNRFMEHSDTLPAPGAADEYSALFEAAWPEEKDRRTVIDKMIRGMKPTQGHLALAALMKARHSNIVWTTNFDHLLADAAALAFGTTGALNTASLDGSLLAGEFISEHQWPIEVKLHGDFRSRRLKNIGEELRHQDAAFRRQLIDACGRYGLILAGYSGRDDSVMDALQEAAHRSDSFPNGLFWLHRGDTEPYERVVQLLTVAASAGVEVGLVRIQNFDEAMIDLLRLLPDTDDSVLRDAGQDRSWFSPAPRVGGKRGYPLLRMNALPVEIPINCRRITCDIGGTAEVRGAIARAGSSILATRTRDGIIGFGSDTEFRRTFESFDIQQISLASFDAKRLRTDSQERGLLRSALSAAISRERDMTVMSKRGADILCPIDPSSTRWVELRRLIGPLAGEVPKLPGLNWKEGLSLRLDWASDRPWLLIEPRIVFDGRNDQNKALCADFAREKTAQRYNATLDAIINFWASVVSGADLRALGIGDGIDAVFSVGTRTAASRMAKP